MNGQTPAWTVPIILLALGLCGAAFVTYGRSRLLAWVFMLTALAIVFGGAFLLEALR
jgi:hypothetical protein